MKGYIYNKGAKEYFDKISNYVKSQNTWHIWDDNDSLLINCIKLFIIEHDSDENYDYGD